MTDRLPTCAGLRKRVVSTFCCSEIDFLITEINFEPLEISLMSSLRLVFKLKCQIGNVYGLYAIQNAYMLFCAHTENTSFTQAAYKLFFF